MSNNKEKELISIIDKYYTDAPAYQPTEGGIRINQIGFMDNLYDDPMQVATQIVISSFNSYSFESQYIYTFPITAEMIVARFGFTSRPSDKVKKVILTIQELVDKGIVSCSVDAKSIKKNTSFVIHQDITKKSIASIREKKGVAYTTIENHEFMKLISPRSELTDTQTINILAVYGAIVSRINTYNPEGHRTGFAYGNRLLNAVATQSYNTIGKTINLAKSSVDSYIHLLIELKVIASIKVSTGRGESYVWSRYYSKYSERIILKEFIKWLVKEGYPETDKLSYINIKDVWAEKKYPQ